MRASLACITTSQLPSSYSYVGSSVSIKAGSRLCTLRALFFFFLQFVALHLTKQSPMLLFSGWSLPNWASSYFEPPYRTEGKRGVNTSSSKQLFKLCCYSRSRNKTVLDGFKTIQNQKQPGEEERIRASCSILICLSPLLCCSQTYSVIWENLSY